MLRVMVKLLMFAMWLSFPVKWCDAAIDSTLRFLFKCLNQISTSPSLHLGSVGSSHGCPVHQTLSHGHGFTTAIFMIALFQWSLARPIKALLQSRQVLRGNAVREIEEFTARTNEEAKPLQRCHYCKMQWLERAWRPALFLECVLFPYRGVAVASKKRFEIALKKIHTHWRATSSLFSLVLYIFFYTSAQSSQLQLRDCGYYHSNATRPKDYLHDAAALGRPQRREKWEAWGRREILLKIVSLDTRDWRRLIRSDLK